jgi:hypothetical protein
MDDETVEEEVEEAAEHAERSIEQREQERRAEAEAEATRGASRRALEGEAAEHLAAADEEELEAEEAADAALRDRLNP